MQQYKESQLWFLSFVQLAQGYSLAVAASTLQVLNSLLLIFCSLLQSFHFMCEAHFYAYPFLFHCGFFSR